MTLVDTGPLVALVDSRDFNHSRCLESARTMNLPFVTTTACLTEAIYLLGKAAGFRGQAALFDYVKKGILKVFESSATDLQRAFDYMEIYKDVPCDFADATILVLAEKLDLRAVFTLDSHFFAYRINGSSIEIHPERN